MYGKSEPLSQSKQDWAFQRSNFLMPLKFEPGEEGIMTIALTHYLDLYITNRYTSYITYRKWVVHMPNLVYKLRRQFKADLDTVNCGYDMTHKIIKEVQYTPLMVDYLRKDFYRAFLVTLEHFENSVAFASPTGTKNEDHKLFLKFTERLRVLDYQEMLEFALISWSPQFFWDMVWRAYHYYNLGTSQLWCDTSLKY